MAVGGPFNDRRKTLAREIAVARLGGCEFGMKFRFRFHPIYPFLETNGSVRETTTHFPETVSETRVNQKARGSALVADIRAIRVSLILETKVGFLETRLETWAS